MLTLRAAGRALGPAQAGRRTAAGSVPGSGWMDRIGMPEGPTCCSCGDAACCRPGPPSSRQGEIPWSAELREQAARSQAQAAQLVRRAARRLRDQGLPQQDVGKALGVSFQRAKQLIDEADKLAS